MMPGPLALATEALMEPHLGKVGQDGEPRNRECGKRIGQEPRCTSGPGARDGEHGLAFTVKGEFVQATWAE